MVVAVFKAGTPHHNAVVKKRAFALLEASHFFHHIGKLRDVEGGDGCNLGLGFILIPVMGEGVVVPAQTEFGIGHTVWCGTNVGTNSRGVGLEGEHIKITHHLHVFTAFFADGDFDLDGR